MNDQNSLTQKKMLQELYTSWFGVPGTDDRGAIEDLKELKRQMDGIKSLVIWRRVHTWAIGSILTILLATLGLLLAHSGV